MTLFRTIVVTEALFVGAILLLMALLPKIEPDKKVTVPAGSVLVLPRAERLGGSFEGDGAITLTCLWRGADLYDYSDKNLRTGWASLAVAGDDNIYELSAAFDTPRGTLVLTGERCTFSIDYSSLPVQHKDVPIPP